MVCDGFGWDNWAFLHNVSYGPADPPRFVLVVVEGVKRDSRNTEAFVTSYYPIYYQIIRSA